MYSTLAPSTDVVIAPSPIDSEDHIGISFTSTFAPSLVPDNARRGPSRARATYRAVA